jgi:hypothetical protein
MADLRTFAPGFGTGITISATTSSSNTALRGGSQQVVVTNRDATNAIYFRTDDDSGAVATAADYIVLPGQQISITRAQDHAFIAVVAAAGTATVHAIIGDGI